jgi:hypothetical protein
VYWTWGLLLSAPIKTSKKWGLKVSYDEGLTDPKIKKQELIKLSDGIDANYFEINLRF